MNKIFYGKQFIDKKDINAAVKCLKSNYLTTGPKVTEFERYISKTTGSKYSLTCNSGTSAIFLVALTLKLRKGDNIIVPNINFIASFNIFTFLGCKVHLADVDELSGQITPKTIEECIKREKIKELKCFVTMPLGGQILNIEGFKQIKKKFDCYWMEDNCHALGSNYYYKKKLEKAGSCKYSDFSIFSFHPIKAITTFEGGCINFRNKKDYENAKLLRSHGIIRKKNYWEYDVVSNGFNFRLNDVSASVGISQLKKLNKFVKRREGLAKIYYNLLKKNPNVNFTFKSFPKYNSWHLFIILINFKSLKILKSTFIKKMTNKNIYPQVNYIPTSYFSVYKKKRQFPSSAKFFNRAVSLPIFFDLKNEQVKKICEQINRITIQNEKRENTKKNKFR